MKKATGFYPRVHVDAAGSGVVSQAGGVLLVETVRASGLDRLLSAALASWRRPLAVHDPAKVITDLAVTLALGGDCLSDVAVLRAEPALFGRVASDPTVSRTIDALATAGPRALASINAARAAARARVWTLAGRHAPDAATDPAHPLVIDLDATLVTAHSDKEQAKSHVQAGVRLPPAVGLRRPRPRGHRGAAGGGTADGQRRVQHRRRPHRRDPRRAAAAALAPARQPARTSGAGPHRRRRVHARGGELADRAAVVLLARVSPSRRRRQAGRPHPHRRLDAGLRRRRRGPRRCLGG